MSSTQPPPSIATGLSSSDTPSDALLAQVAAAAENLEPVSAGGLSNSYAEAKVDNDDSLAALPGSDNTTGKIAKPRARKSPGSGSKSRSEPSKRKFICSFSHYGCDVALSSKNEWKRHVSIQHLQLGFYRCDVGSCNPDNNPNTPPHKKVYNDFNRKDLFTQHHRRMHKPDSIPGGVVSQDPNSADWRAFEDSLEDVRTRCWQEKRRPPQRSTCGFCGRVFESEGSWNERMEHVGGHYSRDLPEVCKEEREDEDLTNWSIQEGIVKEGPNGRHILIDQPLSSVDRPFNNRNIDISMTDAPPISPSSGQPIDGQFIGMNDSRRQSLQQIAYPPINGSGRPGSSSGQHDAPYPLPLLPPSFPTWKIAVPPLPTLDHMPNDRDDADRLEDLINTLINPKKPRMSKRLQWRCDCGLDSSVDFAEENVDDQRAFANLGKISIICKNSQSPYLKTSKTEQYEIIPCNELHPRIASQGKFPTDHALPPAEEVPDTHQQKQEQDDIVSNDAAPLPPTTTMPTTATAIATTS